MLQDDQVIFQILFPLISLHTKNILNQYLLLSFLRLFLGIL
ncbi:hypothetical protein PRO82_001620 [Candidatus Protochlamydia amoebophila]|nr:hypothetical protein [Candidatus Protochlamydia amoebophila]